MNYFHLNCKKVPFLVLAYTLSFQSVPRNNFFNEKNHRIRNKLLMFTCRFQNLNEISQNKKEFFFHFSFQKKLATPFWQKTVVDPIQVFLSFYKVTEFYYNLKGRKRRPELKFIITVKNPRNILNLRVSISLFVQT